MLPKFIISLYISTGRSATASTYEYGSSQACFIGLNGGRADEKSNGPSRCSGVSTLSKRKKKEEAQENECVKKYAPMPLHC
jgi:hypothetical protein